MDTASIGKMTIIVHTYMERTKYYGFIIVTLTLKITGFSTLLVGFLFFTIDPKDEPVNFIGMHFLTFTTLHRVGNLLYS